MSTIVLHEVLALLARYLPVFFGLRELLVGHTNAQNGFDVTGDGWVSALDVLTLITDLNKHGSRPLSLRVANVAPFLDPSGNLEETPQDVLLVINWLNSVPAAVAGEGESVPTAVAGAAAVRVSGSDGDLTAGIVQSPVRRSSPSDSGAASTVLGDARPTDPARWSEPTRVARSVESRPAARRKATLDIADRSLLLPDLEDVLAEFSADVCDAWQQRA